MTPNFCRHCGHSVVAGAAFCGGCGRAVEAPATAPAVAPVTAHVPAAYVPAAPAAPVTPVGSAAGSRGVGGVLLIGLLAVVVMLGMGVGTAYVLTRGDDSSSSAGDTGERRDDGDDGAPAPSTMPSTVPSTGDVAADPTATVTVTESAPTEPPGDGPETVLREAIAADEDDVLALEGSWVPQLASISDDINGSWPAALEEYERLRGAYPDALVVDAEAWPHSFIRSETFDTVLVVLLPTPASPYSAPVLDWCRLNRGDRQASCYAKRIETAGSPRDNTDQNQPEPEFN